jgi:hypothetical protein
MYRPHSTRVALGSWKMNFPTMKRARMYKMKKPLRREQDMAAALFRHAVIQPSQVDLTLSNL